MGVSESGVTPSDKLGEANGVHQRDSQNDQMCTPLFGYDPMEFIDGGTIFCWRVMSIDRFDWFDTVESAHSSKSWSPFKCGNTMSIAGSSIRSACYLCPLLPCVVYFLLPLSSLTCGPFFSLPLALARSHLHLASPFLFFPFPFLIFRSWSVGSKEFPTPNNDQTKHQPNTY